MPVALDDATTIPWDGVASVAVAANDTDPDGDLDRATISLVDVPDGGAGWSVSGAHVVYHAASAGPGDHTAAYEICDPTGLCDRAGVTVTVTPDPNRAPEIAPIEPVHTAVGMPVRIELAAVDPDDDPLTWTARNLPDGLRITSDGVVHGELTDDVAPGEHTFDVTVSDGRRSTTEAVQLLVARHRASPHRGHLFFSEVRYAGTTRHDDGDDSAQGEFVEIVNGGDVAIDVTAMVLRDTLDAPVPGAIVMAFDDEDTRGRASVLGPGERAVVWIGRSPRDAGSGDLLFVEASHGRVDVLHHGGEDLWLFDRQGHLVDYVAWGSGHHILATPPGPAFFDDGARDGLAAALPGQSISLATPVFAPHADCWEHTTSGTAGASGRCRGAAPTIAVAGRGLASPGRDNLVR